VRVGGEVALVARLDLHLLAELDVGARELLVAHVQRHVAELVDREHVRVQHTVLHVGLRQLDALELGRVELLARLAKLGADRQVRRDRREHVAAVEGGRHRLDPVGRAAHVEGLGHAAGPFPGEAQHAVVGAYEQAPVAGADRHAAALGAHLRVHDRDVYADRHVGQRVA
jgi:hypothetical protein